MSWLSIRKMEEFMSNFKKAASRLLVLGGLIAGALYLSQPTPAQAFSCASDCFAAYQACRQSGQLGCDAVYVDCLNNCNGG
jgi:hypothetical protein